MTKPKNKESRQSKKASVILIKVLAILMAPKLQQAGDVTQQFHTDGKNVQRRPVK